MELREIVTLASARVRLAFLAMERSLRGAGCKLPLRVIPYGDERFALPPGSEWWEEPEILGWLSREGPPGHAGRVMRKYQCLGIGGYQFVDSDVVFLESPADALASVEGFVTSCGHWHNPGHTYTGESLEVLRARSTVWQARVFNSGQFACDRALYPPAELRRIALESRVRGAVLGDRFHEQPGMNLLVALSGVPVTNLTLPPRSMESTWAGDYPGEFERYWAGDGRRPYLIHWAGMKPDGSRPIDGLFLGWLTREERLEWEASPAGQSRASRRGRVRELLRRAWGRLRKR